MNYISVQTINILNNWLNKIIMYVGFITYVKEKYMTIIDANSPSKWYIDSRHYHSKSQQYLFVEIDKQILKFIWNAKNPEEPKQLWKGHPPEHKNFFNWNTHYWKGNKVTGWHFGKYTLHTLWPSNSTTGYIPTGIQAQVHQEVYTSMFKAVLIIIIKN